MHCMTAAFDPARMHALLSNKCKHGAKSPQHLGSTLLPCCTSCELHTMHLSSVSTTFRMSHRVASTMLNRCSSRVLVTAAYSTTHPGIHSMTDSVSMCLVAGGAHGIVPPHITLAQPGPVKLPLASQTVLQAATLTAADVHSNTHVWPAATLAVQQPQSRPTGCRHAVSRSKLAARKKADSSCCMDTARQYCCLLAPPTCTCSTLHVSTTTTTTTTQVPCQCVVYTRPLI